MQNTQTTSSMPSTQSTSNEGRYIYGIIHTDRPLHLGTIGIGARGDNVYTVNYQQIAALVSPSPILGFAITRQNITAHSQVLDKAAVEAPVLPVRFCTIAGNDEVITSKVLQPHYQELFDKLQFVSGKVELGLKAYWKNMDAVYAEIVAENLEIQSLKQQLLQQQDEQARYAGSIKVGQLVQQALESRKKREAQAILNALNPDADTVENPAIGDSHFLNAVFLVEKQQEKAFDEKINALRTANPDRLILRSTVSLVPYNFTEITIH